MINDLNNGLDSIADFSVNVAERPLQREPRSVDVEVGARIKFRRRAMRLSQTKLGEVVGVTFQQIQKYEKGTSRVSASAIVQISKVLTVPVSYFFDGKLSDQTGDDVVLAFVERGEGNELFQAFSRIKRARVRKQVVRLVEELALRER